MVKIMETPIIKMDNLGGSPIFGNTHIWTKKLGRFLQQGLIFLLKLIQRQQLLQPLSNAWRKTCDETTMPNWLVRFLA